MNGKYFPTDYLDWLTSENIVDNYYIGSERAGSMLLTLPSHVGLPPPLPMLAGSMQDAMTAISSAGCVS